MVRRTDIDIWTGQAWLRKVALQGTGHVYISTVRVYLKTNTMSFCNHALMKYLNQQKCGFS